MNTFNWASLAPALPEIFLAVVCLGLLMVGVFSKAEHAARNVAGLALAGLVVTLFLVWLVRPLGGVTYAFDMGSNPVHHFFINDLFATFMKSLVLVGAACALILSPDFLTRTRENKFEFYVLMLLSVLGMLLLISANNMLALYLGLELMSFSLYILCAFRRDNLRSTEAGLKYYVLGSLSSCILLFGISLFYGLTGSFGFDVLQQAFTASNVGHSLPHLIALVMVFSALTFKISAVPFHMWTPDVYEGAPLPVTAFLSAVPKVAGFAIFIRVLVQPLVGLETQWVQILIVLSILTMAVGVVMAAVQPNIKRLLAYSSIGHVGFMLVGLVAGTSVAVQAVLLYLVVYVAMILGIFGVLLLLRHKDVFVETLDDIAGLSRTSPMAAFALLLLFFSLAGVPPLAGFFAKFYVFAAAVKAGYTWLAVLGVIFSVVGAYYCLKVIRVMYFDSGDHRHDVELPRSSRLLVGAITVAVLLFAGVLNRLDTVTGQAAASLFQGEVMASAQQSTPVPVQLAHVQRK